MPYREKRIYSGRYLEIEIYPISLHEKSRTRKAKLKQTRPKQRNLNDRNAKKPLNSLAEKLIEISAQLISTANALIIIAGKPKPDQ